MQEQAIFTEALEKEDATQRAAYLDRVCAGDSALRSRIERLLEQHGRAGNFLETPAMGSGSPQAAFEHEEQESLNFLLPSDNPAALGRLGHYDILEVVGRGGMGIVLR